MIALASETVLDKISNFLGSAFDDHHELAKHLQIAENETLEVVHYLRDGRTEIVLLFHPATRMFYECYLTTNRANEAILRKVKERRLKSVTVRKEK